MFTAKGVLKYYEIKDYGYRLIVDVKDKEIANYYFSLIPLYKYAKKQFYPLHISIVRNEIPGNLEVWGKYNEKEVKFFYEAGVKEGTVYFWLNCFSLELEEIRRELGLPVDSKFGEPPAPFSKFFHMTIGNKK